MFPPREEGWYAEDFDGLGALPPRTELLHGAMVFPMWPSPWADQVADGLALALTGAWPHRRVQRAAAVVIDRRNRLIPDLVVAGAGPASDPPLLVVEAVSPESAYRDRRVKPRKYADAGVGHYWLVEREGDQPVVHVYELDVPAGAYASAGIFREELVRPVPFPITVDLTTLLTGRRPD